MRLFVELNIENLFTVCGIFHLVLETCESMLSQLKEVSLIGWIQSLSLIGWIQFCFSPSWRKKLISHRKLFLQEFYKGRNEQSIAKHCKFIKWRCFGCSSQRWEKIRLYDQWLCKYMFLGKIYARCHAFFIEQCVLLWFQHFYGQFWQYVSRLFGKLSAFWEIVWPITPFFWVKLILAPNPGGVKIVFVMSGLSVLWSLWVILSQTQH